MAAAFFAASLCDHRRLPGFLTVEAGGIVQVTALDVRDDRIAAINVTRNPDKLKRLPATVSV